MSSTGPDSGGRAGGQFSLILHSAVQPHFRFFTNRVLTKKGIVKKRLERKYVTQRKIYDSGTT
jgi:hypothetical protein